MEQACESSFVHYLFVYGDELETGMMAATVVLITVVRLVSL